MTSCVKVWFGPDGYPMSRANFKISGYEDQSPDMWVVHKFENARLAVEARVLSVMEVSDAVPTKDWKPFVMEVYNIVTTDPDGFPLPAARRVLDFDASGSFRTRKELDTAYENLMVNYTDSYFSDGNGELIEVGNKLGKDVPQTVAGSPEAEESGSW